jgi:Flp pilus assembly CpaF family ATPase
MLASPAGTSSAAAWAITGQADADFRGGSSVKRSDPWSVRQQPLSQHRDDEIDWALVRAFRQQAAEQLSNAIRDQKDMSRAVQRERGRTIVTDLLSAHADDTMAAGLLTYSTDQQILMAKAVFDALFGLGRLQPLVDNPDVENIEITGYDCVLLEFSDGRLEFTDPVADSDEELIENLTFLASRSEANERPFSAANPTLHLRLDGGARLAASAWITPRPAVVIRRHRLREVTIADLVARDMMDPGLGAFLDAAVRAGKSLVISGPQGSGKTTLIRALCSCLDPMERIGTAETEYELHLHELPDKHKRVIAWEARPGSGERGPDGKAAGEITLGDILYDSFRFNLQRIIVGEVRGKEVLEMLKAMQSGAGSMSTTHAYAARAAIERLVTLAMEAGPHVTEQFAYRQIGEHINLIVQIELEKLPEWDTETNTRTVRRVRYVSQVIALEGGGEGGRPAITDVYKPGPDGRAAANIMPNRLRNDLEAAGYNSADFHTAGTS